MVVFFQTLLFLFLTLLSLFMILIILLQRGKGGGLVGAFGGMGGQSAFGIKSSDVFLRITVVAAIIWFVTCIGGRYLLEMKTTTTLVDGKRPAVATDSTNAENAEASATTETNADATQTTPDAAAVPAADPAPAASTTTDAPAADATPTDSVPAP